MNVATASAAPGTFPALVLNADYRPLSYYPLSLWGWQDAVKAVFLDRVNIVSEYDRSVRSPTFEMKLPSVVSLKNYVRPALYPAFTRFNVFLRDRFTCQYCGDDQDLTFDTAAVDQIVHAIQAAKERGFTTAGWSDQRGDRIFFDLHVQIDQRLFLTVKQVQVLYVKNYILHSYLLIPSL